MKTNISSIIGGGRLKLHDSSSNLKRYLETIENQLKNPIIKSFLSVPKNMELLKQVIEHPTDALINQLDESFKDFYFKIRFTSYLSKTIHFNAINFDKNNNLNSSRYKLILDKPLHKETETTFIDVLATRCKEDTNEYEFEMILDIEDRLSNYWLYKGFQQLTENQRQILSLTYLHGFTDSEIANLTSLQSNLNLLPWVESTKLEFMDQGLSEYVLMKLAMLNIPL